MSTNKKVNILCDTNQMAYGSSSALLAILCHLDCSATAFVWGITKEILGRSNLIDHLIEINNKEPKLVQKKVRLENFDAVLVISNLTNIPWYLENQIPIYFVDLHHWYPAPKNHAVWKAAKRCYVERFVKSVNELPGKAIEVGPIIKQPIISKPIKKQVLVNIGGGENRWIKPGINSNYLKYILELLQSVKKELPAYKFIIAAGKKAIASLPEHLKRSFIINTFEQSEYLENLSESEFLFTSPGLNAVYEGLYFQKKVIFLPPQNVSQVLQLNQYEECGLVEPGLNLVSQNSLPDFIKYFDEEQLSYKVLKLLKDKWIDGIKEDWGLHIINQINQVNINKQNKIVDKLGEIGGEKIAADIKSDLLNDVN